MTPENHIDALHKAISNMKKQTAVEWLWEQIDGIIPYQDMNTNQQFIGVLEQAKAMEEEQIKSAWNDGWKTATFKKCDWSEHAYYEQLKNNNDGE
jgi:ribosome modulation factor